MLKVNALVLERDIVRSKAICNLLGVVSFIALTTMGAYIRIPVPFSPVPITMQTLFVILSGAMLGARLGLVSQAGYLILGASGLPVFQGYASGPTYMMGPTCGYLIGFILAPLVVGKLVSLRKDATFGWVVFSMLVGSLVILSLGVGYLTVILNVSLGKGFVLGALYFLPGDFVKMIAASGLYRSIGGKVRSIFKIDS